MGYNKPIDALMGVAIGDALGVPFEFLSREEMQQRPASSMIGHGSHDQAPGTWSDDSSLTFCLAEALTRTGDLSLQNIAINFVKWRNEAYWTAHNEVFDIGITTSKAITRLEKILIDQNYEDLKNLLDNSNEYENGNGSLMRILPLVFHLQNKAEIEQYKLVCQISALTHKHERAAMSCFIYLKMAEYLLKEEPKEIAYQKTRNDIQNFWELSGYDKNEQRHFQRLIQNDVKILNYEDLKSGGYVIEVLESSFWCLLECNNYKETVLKIINLGHDTDTSAAIAGGLAGLYYGLDTIPKEWVNAIYKKDQILLLGDLLAMKYGY